ncbi:hypothetical protein AWV79_20255 [Cupriavidus sp. UYMMa02A]|nr:hypothetical protein AWV79_20255 [Cupriavidus sp. UYMMa02A]
MARYLQFVARAFCVGAIIVIVAIVSRQIYLRSAAETDVADADEEQPPTMMLIRCKTMHTIVCRMSTGKGRTLGFAARSRNDRYGQRLIGHAGCSKGGRNENELEHEGHSGQSKCCQECGILHTFFVGFVEFPTSPIACLLAAGHSGTWHAFWF